MRFSTMLFNVVEKCNIRCRHCGYADSKRRGSIADHHLVDWVRQAVEYGIPQITFSGGEVFTEFELLKKGVESVYRAGGNSGVFTNGAWGETEGAAYELLEQLPGLDHLHLSCDVYHLEWVPAEYLLNIIRAAKRLEEFPKVIINISHTNEEDKQAVTSLFDKEQDSIFCFHYQKVIPSEYVQLRVDDAREQTALLGSLEFGSQCYLHTPTVHTTGILWTCHIGTMQTHPFPDYRSSPYFLGDLKSEKLKDIFDRAEMNRVYQMLRVFGPRTVAESAMTSPCAEELRNCGYTSDCDMCYQVLPRQEVRARIRELAKDPEVQKRMKLARALILEDGPENLDRAVYEERAASGQ